MVHLVPANAPLPARLRALASSGFSGWIREWRLDFGLDLTGLFPGTERDLVQLASRHFLAFARSSEGDVLALDLRSGEPERGPVVRFDSEGGFAVLGDCFDDFLAILASDVPDAREGWEVDDSLRQWIVASGLVAHPSVTARLAELGAHSVRFWREWADELRSASRLLRPSEELDYELGMGVGLGPVSLGQARVELDSMWGAPSIPAWGRAAGRFVALYRGIPFGVELDATTHRVVAVSLYGGRHRALAEDGFDLMFATRGDVLDWLARRGYSANVGSREICVAEAKLALGIKAPPGDAEPGVVRITISDTP